MDTLEWIVWGILAFFTFIMLITWVYKRKRYRHGHFYSTAEVVTLYSIPRILIAETILLLSFLFVDINKLNLLWLYPAIYFFINFMMARKVEKADKERND